LAFMFGLKPEEVIKAMKRLGITIEEVQAVKVIVDLEDGSKITVDNPTSALIVRSKDQPPVLMIVGEYRVSKPEVPTTTFSEEDVRFVAEQANVSLEEARRALEMTRGDVAAAIVRLTEKQGS